ncbi:MAG: NADH-quinone oxidoreductase subunit C [Candidatus Omnitrophota bacterium]|nr:NADH-quinone oxidoreductase subunit C [Candidatus Omnitrophota bacterium]
MLPAPNELKQTVEQLLPGVSLTLEGDLLLVAAHELPAVCRCLKEHERFHLDYLANLTAVDYPPTPASSASPPEIAERFRGLSPGNASHFTGQNEAAGAGRIEVVYHLYSMAKKHGPVALKVRVPRSHPVVPSVTPIWRGAEFQEREVYDLFGVTFEGHPDLRRILMWEGFDGHPLRKDYVVEDQDLLEERR